MVTHPDGGGGGAKAWLLHGWLLRVSRWCVCAHESRASGCDDVTIML